MKTYHSMVLRGNLRTAVRWITEQEKRGVLHPKEHCTKTGERLMEVLHTKNPDARPLSTAILDTYVDQPPDLVPVNIMDDTVTELSGCLSGGSGWGGGATW